MPNKSKAENAAALLSAGIPRKSWSIPEFCARHGISPGLYDKLKKLGLGPHETERSTARSSPTMTKTTGCASAKPPAPPRPERFCRARWRRQ